MVQYIKPGSLFGRIGSGIGKGLAEQLPEEIQRGRLSSGLKNFEKEHQNLNPMQQLARISAIPGITPQMIQSFSELAKITNRGNAFRRAGGDILGQIGVQDPTMAQVQQANLVDQAVNSGSPMQQQFNPAPGQARQAGIDSGYQTRNEPFEQKGELTYPTPRVSGPNQLENYNPGDPNAITRLPWTPNQRNARIIEYMNQGFLVDQAKELAADDEARDLAVPGAVQKQQQEKRSRGQEAENILTKQLETRLQKSGEGVFTDITGDMLADLKRAMSKAVVENPNASAEDIAEDFSKRALRLAKTKKEVQGLGQTTGWESIFTGDKVLNKLRSFQKSFEDAGNQEEYFNILRSDFGLSPQGAAVIAYPAKAQIKKYVDSYKPNNFNWGRYGRIPNSEKIDANSRKAALDISKIMDDDDSVLAVARMLSEKDPYFDQRAFFEELSQNPSIRLNPRQRQESSMGERDYLPTWGDIKIFPALRRSTK